MRRQWRPSFSRVGQTTRRSFAGSALAYRRNAIAARTRSVFRARTTRRSLAPPSTRGFWGLGARATNEKKVLTFTGNIAVSAAAAFTLLTAPVQGSDFVNRIGRRIIVKSVFVRGYIQTEGSLTQAAAGAPAQQCRLIILVDMQPNGAVPAITDILEGVAPHYQLNLNNRDRFKILRDTTYELGVYDKAAAGGYSTADENIACVKV